jgi:hypothetical protein
MPFAELEKLSRVNERATPPIKIRNSPSESGAASIIACAQS